ncbi:serine/threonine protein kinase [Streptomyces sp. NPDC051555]|uniref:serine/threonine protein kinase n=1 Tax=Streptomyces sp. NPDC051555 TaxID=3365657 RepID=UPI0037BC3523
MKNSFLLEERTVAMIEKGTLLNGRYKVGEEISVGGQAHLYAAHDLETGEVVAVKAQLPLVLQSVSQYREESREMQREACRSGRLSALTRIPKVVDRGWYKGDRYYVVMSFIDGVMLYDSVISARPFKDLATTASVIGQFCEILHVVHENGFVHRDVKPENAILDWDGTLWVLDLGFAVKEGRATLGGYATRGYAAPEQFEDREEGVTPRADVFALGCILLELTTMYLPYRGMYGRPSLDVPAIPPEVDRLVPPEFHSLILRMVAMDPGDRPDLLEVFESLRLLIPVRGAAPPVSRIKPDPTEHFRRHGHAL